MIERAPGIAGDGDQCAARIETLILEAAEMVPAADLDGAGEPVLIVLVGALDHQQRLIVELEIETVIVAALRVFTGARRCGVAIIDADHDAELVVRVDGDAHAGRGQRIGGAAARQVGGGDRRPAPGAVEKISATIAGDKLLIGGKLADAHGQLLVEHGLLEPQLEQAGGVGRFEIGDRHERADIGGGDRIAVDLITVGVEAEAPPKAKLLHVGIDIELEHAVILAALVEAAPVVERLAVIIAADADAAPGKPLAHAACVELEGCIFWNAGIGHVAIGPRFGRKGEKRHGHGEGAQGFGKACAIGASVQVAARS